MTTLKAVALTLSMIAVTTVGVAACAHMDRDNGDRSSYMAERITHRISNKLDLNEPQQAKLDALVSKLQQTRNAVKARRENDRNELKNLLRANKLDQQQLLMLIEEKTTTVETEAPALISVLADFTDSLDEQQREKLAAVLDKRFDNHHHWSWK